MPAATAYLSCTGADALNAAWRRTYGNARAQSRDTPDATGESLTSFGLSLSQNISRIARDLRRHEYEFGELRPVFVPKSSGGDRLICVPTVRDRVVQRALLAFLSPKYSPLLSNAISHGFIPERGVQTAAKQACELRSKKPFVLKTDIKSFFDTIPRERLREALKMHIRQTSLHEILIRASECEIAQTSQDARVKKLEVRRGVGIRQGMPLSPFFSNLLLHPVDRKLIACGLFAVRYADDMIFFADSEEECRAAFAECARLLQPLGLSLPPLNTPGSKSTISLPDQSVEFLGLSLGPAPDGAAATRYELRVTRKQLEKVRSAILSFSSARGLIAQGVTLATLGRRLEARCDGYLSAYLGCANHNELVAQISDLRQSALTRLYRDDLHIPLAHLNAHARVFLGLS